MDWLTSQPVGVLVAGWLAFALLIAFGARLAIRAIVPVDEYDDVQRVGAPLMPALGAAFGVLIGLTLASEAGYLKSAQDIVADEAAAASRLAWAATSPGVSTAADPPRPRRLSRSHASRTSGATTAPRAAIRAVADSIATMERVVRAEAARSELGTPASTELLVALDAVTSGRRDRVAAASREIPLLYVITLVVGGVALIANAGALGVRSTVRTTLLSPASPWSSA